MQRREGLPHADFQRLLCVDHGFGMHDGFEARLYFEVELEVAIACGMGVGLCIGR